jgi:activator of HSP90 ATPase
MPTTTANWHWKNKNVGVWAKGWFERELTGVSVGGEGDEAVSVERVTNFEGDVELGQRKSKCVSRYPVHDVLACAVDVAER